MDNSASHQLSHANDLVEDLMMTLQNEQRILRNMLARTVEMVMVADQSAKNTVLGYHERAQQIRSVKDKAPSSSSRGGGVISSGMDALKRPSHFTKRTGSSTGTGSRTGGGRCHNKENYQLSWSNTQFQKSLTSSLYSKLQLKMVFEALKLHKSCLRNRYSALHSYLAMRRIRTMRIVFLGILLECQENLKININCAIKTSEYNCAHRIRPAVRYWRRRTHATCLYRGLLERVSQRHAAAKLRVAVRRLRQHARRQLHLRRLESYAVAVSVQWPRIKAFSSWCAAYCLKLMLRMNLYQRIVCSNAISKEARLSVAAGKGHDLTAGILRDIQQRTRSSLSMLRRKQFQCGGAQGLENGLAPVPKRELLPDALREYLMHAFEAREVCSSSSDEWPRSGSRGTSPHRPRPVPVPVSTPSRVSFGHNVHEIHTGGSQTQGRLRHCSDTYNIRGSAPAKTSEYGYNIRGSAPAKTSEYGAQDVNSSGITLATHQSSFWDVDTSSDEEGSRSGVSASTSVSVSSTTSRFRSSNRSSNYRRPQAAPSVDYSASVSHSLDNIRAVVDTLNETEHDATCTSQVLGEESSLNYSNSMLRYESLSPARASGADCDMTRHVGPDESFISAISDDSVDVSPVSPLFVRSGISHRPSMASPVASSILRQAAPPPSYGYTAERWMNPQFSYHRKRSGTSPGNCTVGPASATSLRGRAFAYSRHLKHNTLLDDALVLAAITGNLDLNPPIAANSDANQSTIGSFFLASPVGAARADDSASPVLRVKLRADSSLVEYHQACKFVSQCSKLFNRLRRIVRLNRSYRLLRRGYAHGAKGLALTAWGAVYSDELAKYEAGEAQYRRQLLQTMFNWLRVCSLTRYIPLVTQVQQRAFRRRQLYRHNCLLKEPFLGWRELFLVRRRLNQATEMVRGSLVLRIESRRCFQRWVSEHQLCLQFKCVKLRRVSRERSEILKAWKRKLDRRLMLRRVFDLYREAIIAQYFPRPWTLKEEFAVLTDIIRAWRGLVRSVVVHRRRVTTDHRCLVFREASLKARTFVPWRELTVWRNKVRHYFGHRLLLIYKRRWFERLREQGEAKVAEVTEKAVTFHTSRTLSHMFSRWKFVTEYACVKYPALIINKLKLRNRFHSWRTMQRELLVKTFHRRYWRQTLGYKYLIKIWLRVYNTRCNVTTGYTLMHDAFYRIKMRLAVENWPGRDAYRRSEALRYEKLKRIRGKGSIRHGPPIHSLNPHAEIEAEVASKGPVRASIAANANRIVASPPKVYHAQKQAPIEVRGRSQSPPIRVPVTAARSLSAPPAVVRDHPHSGNSASCVSESYIDSRQESQTSVEATVFEEEEAGSWCLTDRIRQEQAVRPPPPESRVSSPAVVKPSLAVPAVVRPVAAPEHVHISAPPPVPLTPPSVPQPKAKGKGKVRIQQPPTLKPTAPATNTQISDPVPIEFEHAMETEGVIVMPPKKDLQTHLQENELGMQEGDGEHDNEHVHELDAPAARLAGIDPKSKASTMGLLSESKPKLDPGLDSDSSGSEEDTKFKMIKSVFGEMVRKKIVDERKSRRHHKPSQTSRDFVAVDLKNGRFDSFLKKAGFVRSVGQRAEELGYFNGTFGDVHRTAQYHRLLQFLKDLLREWCNAAINQRNVRMRGRTLRVRLDKRYVKRAFVHWVSRASRTAHRMLTWITSGKPTSDCRLTVVNYENHKTSEYV